VSCDVLVVGLDRLAILLQPGLTLPSMDLQGQRIFQCGGEVDAELAGFLQEVAVHLELRGLLGGFTVVQDMAVCCFVAFHIPSIR
jgi:hypothetical protein